MGSDRRLAIVAGALFIVATVANLASIAFLGPVDSKDYLVDIAANGHQVAAGALLLLIGAFASASIAIALYPVLRRYRQGLALGAVGFRLIEGVLYTVGVVTVLSLLTLSREFTASGTADPASFDHLGKVLMGARDWAGVTAILAFYVGGALYYRVFFQSRLVPRWLSGWGLVGVVLGMVAALLVMFGAVDSMSTVQVVLNVPIGVNEIVLAIWLIAKGFRSVAVDSAQPGVAASV